MVSASFWLTLVSTQLSRPDFSSAVSREAGEETRRVLRGYFHVLFDYCFVLIPARIRSVWLCSCRLCVSRGLPRDAAVIRSLLFLPMLSFLSCVWCWFCVWFCYPWLCMLLVIMLMEGLILKAADLRRSCAEDQSWQATKKTRTSFLVSPSGCVSKNVLAGKQDPQSHHSPHPRLYPVLSSAAFLSEKLLIRGCGETLGKGFTKMCSWASCTNHRGRLSLFRFKSKCMISGRKQPVYSEPHVSARWGNHRWGIVCAAPAVMHHLWQSWLC